VWLRERGGMADEHTVHVRRRDIWSRRDGIHLLPDEHAAAPDGECTGARIL